MSAMGFKARVDPLAYMLPCQRMMDLPLVRHLLTSFCSSTYLHSFLQALLGLVFELSETDKMTGVHGCVT